LCTSTGIEFPADDPCAMQMATGRSSTLLTGLAGALAGALIAMALSRAGARHRQQAALLHRTLVDLLLNTLSAGDASTERHSRRVADLTDALAESYGLSGGAHSTLRLAALLHDMGKIDDRFFDILHGCEPLSQVDRESILAHPDQGADILRPLEAIHPGISAIVAAHHECWDGQGYPAGLSGEEIPLESRLISVADVFDAMTQPRRYRPPRTVDEALQEIRSGSGSRFDPAIVARVQSPEIVSKWVRIMEQGRLDESLAAAVSESPSRSAPNERP
jgi:putative nucleotidyltransferase with HDIG domain